MNITDNKLSQLVSFSYFQQSLLTLGSKILHGLKTNYYPTREYLNDEFTKHADGSVSYEKKAREADKTSILNSAKIYSNTKPVYALGGYKSLSPPKTEILETFIHHLQNQNIKIVFYLSPYHPIVYDYFKSDNEYKIVFETEKYFKEFAKKNDIKVIGSFDPSAYHLQNSDFIDAMHCQDHAIKIIYGK